MAPWCRFDFDDWPAPLLARAVYFVLGTLLPVYVSNSFRQVCRRSIACWMLPRFVRGAARVDERLVWLACLVLNAGVLIVGIGAGDLAPGTQRRTAGGAALRAACLASR